MRFLGYFNLVGVAALAVLCVIQWELHRRVSLENVSLDTTRQVQDAKIADLEKTIAGDRADLDGFRGLEQSEQAIREAEARIVKVTTERDQAASERDVTAAQHDRALAERDASGWICRNGLTLSSSETTR